MKWCSPAPLAAWPRCATERLGSLVTPIQRRRHGQRRKDHRVQRAFDQTQVLGQSGGSGGDTGRRGHDTHVRHFAGTTLPMMAHNAPFRSYTNISPHLISMFTRTGSRPSKNGASGAGHKAATSPSTSGSRVQKKSRSPPQLNVTEQALWETSSSDREYRRPQESPTVSCGTVPGTRHVDLGARLKSSRRSRTNRIMPCMLSHTSFTCVWVTDRFDLRCSSIPS